MIGGLDPASGGPPNVALRLAAAQASLGHDTRVISHMCPEREAAIRSLLETIPHIGRVAVDFVARPKGRLGSALAGLPPAARKSVEAADVLHLHGVWEPLLKRVSRVARSAGVPYAVRPAGMLDPWSLRQKWLKKRLALAIGWRDMLNAAAFLHALNADEKRLVEPLRLKCPVRVIPNGVFLEELRPLPEKGTFRAAHPELGPGPFVLFLSRLHYKKGLDYLADAFALVTREVPSAGLVVAGPDGGARASFVKQVARQGLAGRVHLIGPLYGASKLAALVDATCFCLPSRQEGFSVAITEALACGTPVVISEGCHFPEVAEAGAGMVVPLDAARIAEALVRVITDTAAAEQMREAGRTLIASRYTWPLIAEQTVAAYTSVRTAGDSSVPGQRPPP